MRRRMVFIQPTKEGTITKMREEKGGFQVYTLSNGIEVWFQKDEKAANRAYVYLASQGGKAALDKSLYPAFDVATMAAARSGLGGFSVLSSTATCVKRIFHCFLFWVQPIMV